MIKRDLFAQSCFLITIIIVYVALVNASIAYNTWPMFRHNLNHTGYTTAASTVLTTGVQKLWNYTTGGSTGVWSSPAIADINNDGKLEIIFGADDRNVYCLNRTGGKLWNSSIGYGYSSPAIADLNGDGKLEILIGSWGPSKIFCINSTGGKLWNYTAQFVYSSPAIADINNDGKLEIVFGSEDKNVYCLNRTGGKIWNYTTGSPVYSSPTVADINGDGELEIFIGSDDNSTYCLNATGKRIWSYKTGNKVRSSPAIADINNDSKLEIIFGSDDKNFYCLNTTGGKLWNFTTDGYAESSPAIADINGDGKLEIIVISSDRDFYSEVIIPSYQKNVYCLNRTGGRLWSYTGIGGYSSPAIADINGDGKLEIIFGSLDYNVYCLDRTGEKLWNYTTMGPVWSSPAIADINSDGKLDVLVGSWSTDKNLYALTGIAFPILSTSGYAPSTANQNQIIGLNRSVRVTNANATGITWLNTTNTGSFTLANGNWNKSFINLNTTVGTLWHNITIKAPSSAGTYSIGWILKGPAARNASGSKIVNVIQPARSTPIYVEPPKIIGWLTPKPLISHFKYFGKELDGIIVVGKSAAQLDHDCAKKMQALFKNVTTVTDEQALKTNVTKRYGRVVFSIGGPEANKFTLQLQSKMPLPFFKYGFGYALNATRKPTEAVIETFLDNLDSPTQVFFVIAGNWREGTERATNELLKRPEIESNLLYLP